MPRPTTQPRRRFARCLAQILLVLTAAAGAMDWPADRPNGGFTIDPTDRFLVRSFYNSVYRASDGIPMGWSGDLSTCTAGTTSDGFKSSVLARVNFYRALAGIPASVTLRPAYSAAAQQAALIMSANQQLSHSPPDSWTCWSNEGANGAAASNLSLGNAGPDAVASQMVDNGAGNNAVGHRRLILFPQTREIGTGDIPRIAANALWLDDGRRLDPRPQTRDDYVARPPPGYVPYQIVPPRWSFSYPGADFSAATATMERAHTGTPVAVVQETVAPRRRQLVHR